MKETADKNFQIDIELKGIKDNRISVEYKETTDGIPFYELEADGQKVQLRKDGQWKLLWGELDQESLSKIGEAIDRR